MNVDELVAIDIHAHAEVSVRMAPEESAEPVTPPADAESSVAGA
jgi:hypothetical protein